MRGTLNSISYRNNPLMVLMPLTIDRFLAIIAPFLHKNWMSHKIMFTIIGLWWIPATFSSLYRLMKFHMGHIAVRTENFLDNLLYMIVFVQKE